jgi:hypothetical protein
LEEVLIFKGFNSNAVSWGFAVEKGLKIETEEKIILKLKPVQLLRKKIG